MARLAALLMVTLLVPVLAGCTDAPDTTDDGPEPITAGFGHVTIFVKAPLGLDRHPVWSLYAVPRLVAFFPADDDSGAGNGTGDNGTAGNGTADPDNETDDPDEIDEAFVDIARGWTAEWADQGNQADEWPPAARRDWMQPHQVWYEGEVPPGEYERIRIEIIEIMGTDSKGRSLDINLLGDRLSVGPPGDQLFRVVDGERSTFVLDALIERRGDYTYEIR